MFNLLETLATELERPRELSARVVNHIDGTYSVDRDAMGAFLTERLPGLEDYEIDLILSPLFTPKLADQAVFAELLGSESIPPEEWPGLIEQLATRPTYAQLVTSDSRAHAVKLREVTIERYVYRLRLNATIPESLLKLLDQPEFASDRSMLKAIARRSVWDTEARRNLLGRYLTTAVALGSYRLEDAIELLKLMENYQPTDAADLLVRIPQWQRTLEQEINVASKPFFSAHVQGEHGGGRDQRRQDEMRMSAKEKERALLDRLQQALSG